jgi:intein-encoded DNA endonuclease-like protein
MSKRDIPKRAVAYERIAQLRKQNISNKEIIKTICKEFEIPYGTIHGWIKYNFSPFGKRKLRYNESFFYVIGALLGDGCAYYWKKGDKYMVNLVGEKEFIDKYSNKLFDCTGKKVKGYLDRSKNIWNHKTWNFELFQILNNSKKDVSILIPLIKKDNYKEKSLNLIEGFFDAEGCVKIIKEPIRKTPKICLDICSTDLPILEIIREELNRQLNIEARYSIQKYEDRKTAYHLRIYKKEAVRKFLNNINTIKLKPEKIECVNNWLNNGF